MLVIGVVGGICSGKSTVARLFGDLGAVVLDADAAAGVALLDPAVQAAIRTRWGGQVFETDGRLNRAAVSRIVFGDAPRAAKEREFLEGLVHPRVRQSMEKSLAECKRRGAVAAVLDVPLLLEAGWENACDVVVFVASNPDDRRRRAAQRGWPAGELERREASQLPVDQKQRLANAQIDNSKSLDQVATQVHRLWETWKLPLADR